MGLEPSTTDRWLRLRTNCWPRSQGNGTIQVRLVERDASSEQQQQEEEVQLRHGATPGSLQQLREAVRSAFSPQLDGKVRAGLSVRG